MATSIDDNAADEKSAKSRCQLFIIRCTSRVGVKALSTVLYSEGVMSNDRRVIWKNLESDEGWNLILRRKKYN